MVIMNLKDLSIGKKFPEEVHAIVEIPKGSKNKYEYDPELEMFVLDRVLHSAVHYPAAYGFIPQTLWDDGDPLDVLIMISEHTFPGCLVDIRPIGVLQMEDDKGGDDKLLAVASHDPHFDEIRTLNDVPSHTLKEYEHFFLTYKDLEKKKVITRGWKDEKVAIESVKRGNDLYNASK
jgi:inorganic pyrophosphatase